MKPKQQTIADLKPDPKNARKHTPRNVGMIEKALGEVGAARSIVIDENNVVLAGNATIEAAAAAGLTRMQIVDADGETIVAVRRSGLTKTQKTRLALYDNRAAELAEWEIDVLGELTSDELEGMWSDDELGDLLGDDPPSDADAEPQIDRADELRKQWGVETGQLWQLGDHRLLCGDSTKAEDVARVMGGEKAVLLHADPPYGMGKEKDGVQNDNLYSDKLDAFQMAWWRAFRPWLEDNASAYIWGNAEELWRLWYVGGLNASERMTLRSQVIWDKPPSASAWGSPVGSDVMRSYPHGYEACLFFMLGEQGFNTNADNYWEGWEGIRSSLAADCEKMGWGAKDIERICGVGMYGHWFTKSQWAFIPREHYEKLQAAAREHDAFKREHDDLKREFYATRAYFDNAHENMTDVWDFGRVTGEERHGHATPKPVEAMARAVKSSSPEGGIVVEPFLGSGTTLIACEQLGRKCRAIELSPAYVAVAIQRWADTTGGEPQRIDE